MRALALWVFSLLCLPLAGCSLLFDPDDHLTGGDTDAGIDGGGDSGTGLDSGLDGGAPTDAPATDAPVGVDGGRAERCPAVTDPSLFCPGTVDVGEASIGVGGLTPEAHLSLAIVEHGEDLYVVSGLIETGSPYVLYNELNEGSLVNSADLVVDVAEEATAELGVAPTGVHSFALRRVEPHTIGLTFLGAPDAVGSSDVWVGGLLDGASTLRNLSGGDRPDFGHAALSGPGGGATARHFWRHFPSGGGMTLASLPFEDWSEGRWRATQANVEDLEDNVPMRGSDGAFVATIGDAPNEIQLWSGLGADATEPTTIDRATPVIEYTYDGSGDVRQLDFAWIDEDRYALALVVQDGTNWQIGMVRAECSVSCTGDDPEVCTNDCTFGPYESVNPVGGVVDARVAVAGAGPFAVALFTASAISAGDWNVTLSVVDAFNFAEITNPADVPWLEPVGGFIASDFDLTAASRRAGGTVDVVAGWIDDSGFYDLALFQPCLCE